MNRFWIAVLPLAVLGCQTVGAADETAGVELTTQAAPPYDVRQSMIDTINPTTLAIWDIGNNAMSEDGTLSLDPTLMDEAKWNRLAEAAYELGEESARMASARNFMASGPNLIDGMAPEGVSSKDEIQAMIDADPDGYRVFSQSMAQMAAQIYDAAEARDAEKAGQAVFSIDTVCQGCHVKYWYPQQEVQAGN